MILTLNVNVFVCSHGTCDRVYDILKVKKVDMKCNMNDEFIDLVGCKNLV